MKKYLILLISILLATQAYAETIIRKNGNKVLGKIIERNETSIKVELVAGGVANYELSELDTIDGVKVAGQFVKTDKAEVKKETKSKKKEAEPVKFIDIEEPQPQAVQEPNMPEITIHTGAPEALLNEEMPMNEELPANPEMPLYFEMPEASDMPLGAQE